MGDRTEISWSDASWNVLRGCSRVSEGCRNCYAQRTAARFDYDGGPYDGLTRGGGVCRCAQPGAFDQAGRCSECGGTYDGDINWTGEVRFVPEKLDQPLRWRKPRRIFCNSMSDLFHEKVTDEQIAAIFGVMAACPQHTFQILTKRPERMREWLEWADRESAFSDGKRDPSGVIHAAAFSHPGLGQAGPLKAIWESKSKPWPLPNVMLGVSIEDQATADERIPILLETPAAVRFVSAEPLLGPVDFEYPKSLYPDGPPMCCHGFECGCRGMPTDPGLWRGMSGQRIDWVIIGGESGPNARPCNIEWVRSLARQCREAGVRCHLKQLGAHVLVGPSELGLMQGEDGWGNDLDFESERTGFRVKFRDRKGGDMSEWPPDLRGAREFPQEVSS